MATMVMQMHHNVML